MALSLRNLWALWTQSFPLWHGAPINEGNLPSQAGKVFIVTGGSSGIGYELTRILYGAGAKIYIMTKSKVEADQAMSSIEAFYRDKDSQNGSMEFIYVDLADLVTVRTAGQAFLDREGQDGRLDVLFNNAGTAARAHAPPSKQGHEYHFSINVLGGFLLSRLLAPFLSRTARKSPTGCIRVIWPASIMVDAAPKSGIRHSFLKDTTTVKDPNELYASSKVANWFAATEFARRQPQGVVHIAGNPGTCATNIWSDFSTLFYLSIRILLRNPVHGAETYMFMAFSDEVTLDGAAAGRYAINDGRWHPGQREDLLLALHKTEDGGSGRSNEFFTWCEERTDEFSSPFGP